MKKNILFILVVSFSILGFSQEKSLEVLSAAPNPFTNSTKITFTATSEATTTLVVKNILGKTVFNKKIKTKVGLNSFPFYKNDLAKGMYIYSIRDKKKIISKRFVIR